jgi:uncharacterized LabA/DUF88 family protein
MARVSFYIDGFNLYHAVDALNDDRLKWVNFDSLARSYLRKGDDLVSVVFFTAVNNWDPGKRSRHLNFIKAQEHFGVEVDESNFRSVSKKCVRFDRNCRFKEEKKTDVKIALRMLADCYDDKADRLFLLTSDSDQVPTVATIKQRFDKKAVFVIAPPNRRDDGMELITVADADFHLTAGRLRQHILPPEIRNKRGKQVAVRPSLYQSHK